MNNIFAELAAGTLSGVAAMLIEYPFDTVKVLLQMYSNELYDGYIDCARKVFQQDGVLGFYRGVGARAAASGFEHACVFVSYKETLRLIGADLDRPSAGQILLGGCGSGVAATACLTPFELVKCRMQADDGRHGTRRYRSSWDCARQIFRAGGVFGLYRGGVATLMREVPGTAAWCGTYDTLKSYMTPPGQSTQTLSLPQRMWAGGCAGVAFWAVMYPADVAKTRLQVDPRYATLSFGASLGAVYREGGVAALYRGFSLTAIRSFPSNAVLFCVYDLAATHLTHPGVGLS